MYSKMKTNKPLRAIQRPDASCIRLNDGQNRVAAGKFKPVSVKNVLPVFRRPPNHIFI
ncbi:hypothetical protein NEIELOOT_02729 [Neisseria elongata subsp. glycolytica ATCC 29315]|uniref:Uncharacterized protein n=1 Tax=Neisseria elongata subsp. glycolytica ATCC 29315 TaxID=546263 RepID=D4DUG9_NEIEG|nr:hypothetical protein NEIELOOT_02729 [Neisseria elongata subsp. glycolytica ATCC 29315]